MDNLEQEISQIKKQIDYSYQLSDIKDDLNDLYLNGNPRGYHCGFDSLYEFYSILPGRMTFINGAPDSGKSYFWMECLINLSKFHGLKHMLFSPEMGDPHQVYGELISMVMGCQLQKLSEDEKREGEKFVSEYFVIIDPQDNQFTIDDFLYQAELLSEKGFNVDTLTGDPFNEFTHDFKDDHNRQDLYIERILGYMRRKAKATNRHICIITHPRNQEKTTTRGITYYQPPQPREYAGGQAWYRKGLGMLCIWRPPYGLDSENGTYEENEIHIIVQKAKPRGIGKKGTCILYLDYSTHRYYERDPIGIKKYAHEIEVKKDCPF
ncbi:MAG: hypothetical protein ACFFDN_25085 [Candidatus Hodarchaeota archaeon]